MRRRGKRLSIGVRLALAFLLAACQNARPLNAAERPDRLVEIGVGRVINLHCTGRGAITVLLESGFGATSGAWWRVQPEVAKTTRVCSYDRAGYGFSSPGTLPRDGAAIARDLDEALRRADVKGPFVVVGHSAGGLYARLFAARRLKDVAGLVFLDATPERTGPSVPGAPDGLDGIRVRIRGCLAFAESGPSIGRVPPAGCIAHPDDAHELAMAIDPDTWRNQLSELDEIMGRTSDEVQRTGDLLRTIPAYVLTASKTAEASRDYRIIDAPSAWQLRQQQLAASFLQGSERTVISSHMIMIDRPDVVVDAAIEMVRAARAHRPPPRLPPGDTDMPLTGDKPTADRADDPLEQED
jgi:pimeloyl-ACP methyl ester carboxylesterase